MIQLTIFMNSTVNAKVGLQFDQLIKCFKLRFTFDDGTTDILIIPPEIAEMWQKRHGLLISFDGEPLDTGRGKP